MKKVLALLFVCAGLTAMAVTPHVNKNVQTKQGKPAMTLVNKQAAVQKSMAQGKTLTTTEARNMMDGTIQSFFQKNNVTPNDNMLLKKAPRRVTEDALLNANPLFSALTYGYNSEVDSFVLTYPVFTGFWNCDVAQGENENEYNYYAWFTSIPNKVAIDLENNTAEMLAGYIDGFHWTDTTRTGNNRYRYNDTTEYIFLLNEEFLLGTGEQANIPGKVFDDGSIHFNGGWCFYVLEYTSESYSYNNTVTEDSDEYMATDLLRDTWFMTPNGEHSFGVSTSSYSNDVYMYQYDDTTALVWNLWAAFGFGYRNSEIYIFEDGTAKFPVQPIAYEDMTDWNDQYGSQGYNFYDTFYTFGYDATEDQCSEDDIVGTVTASTITWGSCKFGDYFEYSDGNVYYPGIAYTNPADNNVLTWKSASDYWMLGKTEDPIIETETTDAAVIVTLVLEDNAEYAMAVDGELVEFPYSLERRAEDYTVLVQAQAMVPGKNPSEVVEMEVLVPALAPTWTRGDVNMDGSVGIADITRLVDYILDRTNTEGMSLEAADANEDGSIGIADVTKIVDYILNKSWD